MDISPNLWAAITNEPKILTIADERGENERPAILLNLDKLRLPTKEAESNLIGMVGKICGKNGISVTNDNIILVEGNHHNHLIMTVEFRPTTDQKDIEKVHETIKGEFIAARDNRRAIQAAANAAGRGR